MEDLISRQAVMDCFKKWQPYMATRLWDFEQELSKLPSIEQEPCNTDTCKVVKAYMNEWDKPNNSDAISRQQAIKELKESAEHHANDSREETLLRRDIDIIKALPPVTPQQKIGRWIRWYEIIEDECCTIHDPYCKCSECGKEYDPYLSQFIKYCNECGAKMQEVEE